MNINEFMKTQFSARTSECKVPELKEFFGDEPTLWTVRGLTGTEVAIANKAIEKNNMLIAVSEALTGDASEKTEALRELLGVSTSDVPDDLIRKKESLVMGSVNPKCSEEMAVKLSATYPTVFYQLTIEIMRLTGLGQEPGKHKPSGTPPE